MDGTAGKQRARCCRRLQQRSLPGAPGVANHVTHRRVRTPLSAVRSSSNKFLVLSPYGGVSGIRNMHFRSLHGNRNPWTK